MRTETFVSKNCIVRLHHPDLTEEERAKRYAEIKKAAEDVMREVYRLELQKKKKEAGS